MADGQQQSDGNLVEHLEALSLQASRFWMVTAVSLVASAWRW